MHQPALERGDGACTVCDGDGDGVRGYEHASGVVDGGVRSDGDGGCVRGLVSLGLNLGSDSGSPGRRRHFARCSLAAFHYHSNVVVGGGVNGDANSDDRRRFECVLLDSDAECDDDGGGGYGQRVFGLMKSVTSVGLLVWLVAIDHWWCNLCSKFLYYAQY